MKWTKHYVWQGADRHSIVAGKHEYIVNLRMYKRLVEESGSLGGGGGKGEINASR